MPKATRSPISSTNSQIQSDSNHNRIFANILFFSKTINTIYMTDIAAEARSSAGQLHSIAAHLLPTDLTPIVAVTNNFLATLQSQPFIQSYINRFTHPFLLSPNEEVNLLFIMALLRCCQSLSPDSLFRGVFSLILDPEYNLTSATFQNLTAERIGELFGLALEQEYEISTGIYGYEPSPEKKIIQEIHFIFLSSAATLNSLQCDDFHAYFTSLFTANHAMQIPLPLTSTKIITRLLKDFPEFNDTTTIDLSPEFQTLSVITQKDQKEQEKEQKHQTNTIIPTHLDLSLYSHVQQFIYDLFYQFGPLSASLATFQPISSLLEEEEKEILFSRPQLFSFQLQLQDQDQDQDQDQGQELQSIQSDDSSLSFSPYVDLTTVTFFSRHGWDYSSLLSSLSPDDEQLSASLNYSTSLVLSDMIIALTHLHFQHPELSLSSLDQHLTPLYSTYNITITDTDLDDANDATMSDLLNFYLQSYQQLQLPQQSSNQTPPFLFQLAQKIFFPRHQQYIEQSSIPIHFYSLFYQYCQNEFQVE